MLHEPEKFQTEILDEINDILNTSLIKGNLVSEMTYKERCFLNGIIRQTKPKKILELGVSAGGSSALILNAIKDFESAKLYSIDYKEKWIRDENKDTGFVIADKFAHFQSK